MKLFLLALVTAHGESGSNSRFLPKKADMAKNESNTSDISLAAIIEARMQEGNSKIDSFNGTKAGCPLNPKPGSVYQPYRPCHLDCSDFFRACNSHNKPECSCGHEAGLCMISCFFTEYQDSREECQKKCNDFGIFCTTFKMKHCEEAKLECLSKCPA